MPKAKDAKTASVPKLEAQKPTRLPVRALNRLKRRQTELLLCLVALALTTLVLVVWHAARPPRLQINGHSYKLLIARTAAEQQKGLGDRASLPGNEGMLFVFAGPAVRCFWMKDMNFPLDIIWLSPAKQIVHIQPNLSPATYPKVFCPSQLASYVIELNAGQAQLASAHVGQSVSF